MAIEIGTDLRAAVVAQWPTRISSSIVDELVDMEGGTGDGGIVADRGTVAVDAVEIVSCSQNRYIIHVRLMLAG